VADEIIWGYQRVADGDACDFCAMLDGAQFRTDDPMPIHPGCGCGVEPVEYTRLSKGRSRSTGGRSSAPTDPANKITNGNLAPDGDLDKLREVAGKIQGEFPDAKPPNLEWGKCRGSGGWYDPKAGVIRIEYRNRVTIGPGGESFSFQPLSMTYAHEVGHYVDLGAPEYGAWTRGEGWISPWLGEAADARAELLAALQKTKAYKGLLELKKNVAKNYGPGSPRKAAHNTLDYFLSDKETIARAFAQYVGTNHAPGDLKAVLEKLKSIKETDPWHFGQWDDDDFREIMPLIQKYFDAIDKSNAMKPGRQ